MAGCRPCVFILLEMKIMSFWVLFILVFGSVGLAHIIVDSKALAAWRQKMEDSHWKIPLVDREVGEMVNCHQCAGFWTGLLGAVLMTPYFDFQWTLFRALYYPALVFLVGCATSLLSVKARALIDWLNFSINIPLGDFNEEDEENSESVGDQERHTE